MPYHSKAATERALWLTITGALPHIRKAESCDEPEAIRQLDAALADRVLLLKWDEPRLIAGPGDQGPFAETPVYSRSWLGPNRNGDEVLDDAGASEEGRTRKVLLIHQLSIDTTWPTVPKDPARGTAAAETACRKWLEEQMRNSPDRATDTRIALFRNAEGQWPSLSEKAFNRARANAINETGALAWAKPGRPRKSLRS